MTNPARGRVQSSPDTRIQRGAARSVATLTLALAALAPATVRAQAGPAAVAAVTGTVVAASNHRPVAGATIRIPAQDLATTSASDGTFVLSGVRSAWPYRRLDVVVTKGGFAPWTITGAPLYPNDALILSVVLGSNPFTDRVLTLAERAAARPAPAQAEAPLTGTCSDWVYQQVPPPNIWVYRMQTGVSEQYDFEFYAEHVLPNEWISSWNPASLAAGAVAVRTYAAWHELPGNSYSSGSNCADVRDTIDGVFDPSYTTASTVLAVQAAWGSIVYQNGGLFVAHYYAGTQTCAPAPAPYSGWMMQWGTKKCGDPVSQGGSGLLFPATVDTFYKVNGATTKWYYTNNLLLNPNVNSEAMYPWVANGKTTFDRVNGSGDGDSWFIHAAPTVSGRNAIVFQERQYSGTSTTSYRAQVSLRCTDPGASSCAVTVKVVTIPAGGGSWIYRNSNVTVPKDGAWHRYTFDPAAAGVTHTAVRLSVVSLQPYDLDSSILTTPYG